VSLTAPGSVASPQEDVAVTGGPAALSDNSSGTSATVDGPVQWTVTGAPQRVTQYTLTSGALAGDPHAWRLEGSSDGVDWQVLDTRNGQTFTWRAQTRVFSVDKPGSYAQYRLVVTNGDPAVTLSEVELLARP
jgi:hypothetical protein